MHKRFIVAVCDGPKSKGPLASQAWWMPRRLGHAPIWRWTRSLLLLTGRASSAPSAAPHAFSLLSDRRSPAGNGCKTFQPLLLTMLHSFRTFSLIPLLILHKIARRDASRWDSLGPRQSGGPFSAPSRLVHKRCFGNGSDIAGQAGAAAAEAETGLPDLSCELSPDLPQPGQMPVWDLEASDVSLNRR